jgi:Zn-dependent M16 (insulinase) family peptidase
MEHGFLLGAVREKGSAYGATATIDDGIFSMASYRDPRLVDTFDDFEAAVRWASTTELGEQALREAKISTLQRMSNPRTPQQHAVQTLALFFTGTTIEQRRGFRQRLLNARAGEVQRAARVWLEGRPASRRAFTDNTSLLPGMEAIPAWPAPEGRAP